MAANGVRSKEEILYWASAWQARRAVEQEWYEWFDGTRIEDAKDGEGPDAEDLYPLKLNPIAKVCREQRNVMLGITSRYDQPPMQVSCVSTDDTDAARKTAESVKAISNGIWLDSQGASIQQEAALLMQIHGGHVFKLSWEPENANLKYRMRYTSIPSTWFYPVYSQMDKWNLLEAYIGYTISAAEAEEVYGIKTVPAFGNDVTGNFWCLYLEHWTPTHYEITVNGIVPELEAGGSRRRLEGDHNWGFVPVVYIPHHRDKHFYGKSHIPELIGLTEEKNSRSADRGDAVREYTRPLLTASNMQTAPKQIAVEWDSEGNVTRYAVNLGMSKGSPGSPVPELKYSNPPTISDSVISYDKEIWGEVCKAGDLSPVVLGDDDTSGGRITGPVTAYRMLPMLYHTQIERVDFSMGALLLAKMSLKLMQAKQQDGSYKALGVKTPEITDEMLDLNLSTVWNPQIPLDVRERSTMLNERFTAGGMSLEAYLTAQGVEDVALEMKRIKADQSSKAALASKVAAASKPDQPAQPNQENTNASRTTTQTNQGGSRQDVRAGAQRPE